MGIGQLKKDTETEDAQSRSTIYQLAQAMVGEENYKISPAICTRVAIMVRCCVLRCWQYLTSPQRQVYPTSPDGKFWDKVDQVLDSIKLMPEERRFRYVIPTGFNYNCLSRFSSSYLKAILNRDRRAYGVVPGTVAAVPSDDTATGDEPLIQQCIEDLLETPGGSTVFEGPRLD